MSRSSHHRSQGSSSSSSFAAAVAGNRSVFELQESGATAVLLDTVQFHIDGVFKDKASAAMRCDSLVKLIQLCASGRTVLAWFRTNGVAHQLLRVVGLLQSVEDAPTRLALQALALVLSRTDDGSMCEGFDMPLFVFGLLSTSVVQPDPPSSAQSHPATTAGRDNDAVVAVAGGGGGGIHRKRKFAGGGGHTTAPASSSSSSLSSSSASSASSTSSSPDSVHGVLRQMWPSLLQLLGDPAACPAQPQPRALSLGSQVALTVVSRFMISLVHRDTASDGRGCGSAAEAEDDDNDEAVVGAGAGSRGRGGRGAGKGQGRDAALTSLAGYQALLRFEADDAGAATGTGAGRSSGAGTSAGRAPACLLARLVREAAACIADALPALEARFDRGHSPGPGPGAEGSSPLEGVGAAHVSRLFQLLCVLDAACFRCPDNTSVIAALADPPLAPSSSYSYPYSSSSSSSSSSTTLAGYAARPAGGTTNFPRLLVRFLAALFPFIAEGLASARNPPPGSQRQGETEPRPDASTSASNPARTGAVSSSSSSSSSSQPPPGGGARQGSDTPLGDFVRLRNLFPELPTAGPAVSDAPALAIGAAELWLCGVKTLVNLTHDCPAAADLLMAAPSAAVGGSAAELCCAALAVCVSWRESSADVDHRAPAPSSSTSFSSSSSSSSSSSGAAGALSPGETAEERLLFDGALYLLTLLANVAESRPRHACALADADVAAALRRCGLDRFLGPSPSLGAGPGGGRPWRALQTQAQASYCFSPSLAHIRGAAATTTTSPGLAPALTLTQLAVSVLCRESAAFLPDLEAADRQLLARSQQGAGEAAPSPPVQAASQSAEAAVKDKDKLPVAELILSSHAALLLYTLCTGKSNVRDGEDVDGEGDAMAARCAAVRACLPHASWWLPVRALKAFLVLQGQTGVMLVESVRPVVAAVTAMETHDGAPLSFPDAAAAAGRAAAAAASGRKRSPTRPAPAPAPASRSPPKKAPPLPARGPPSSSASLALVGAAAASSSGLGVGAAGSSSSSSSSSWTAALGDDEEDEDEDDEEEDEDEDDFRFSAEEPVVTAPAPAPQPRDAKPKMRARETRDDGLDDGGDAARPADSRASAQGSPASSVVSRPPSQSSSPSPPRCGSSSSSQASHGVAAAAAVAAKAVASLPVLGGGGGGGGFHARRKTAAAGAGAASGSGSQCSGGGFHAKRKVVAAKAQPVASSGGGAFDMDF